MKRLLTGTAFLFALGAAVCVPAFAASAPAPGSELRARIVTLLGDYGRKDADGIVAMLDPAEAVVMGTASTEVATTPAAIRALLESDFRGWDRSRFGDLRNYSVRASGDIATAFFDVPWTATAGSGDRSYVLRVASTWHWDGASWRLAQWTNAVVTVPAQR
jgi:ketosteroid isomerase-like protein